jgi:nucleotide-binding universal stress UspA family protein
MIMKLQCPITKILLPIDGSEHSKRALQFAGCMGTSLGKSLSGLTLLHVITGSYLSRHISYVDFRAEVLKESNAFKRFKEEHVEKDIRPFLDEGERILRDFGVEAEIEKMIVEGDPANTIIRVADEGNFSTIIMAKRGLPEIKVFFLGSVTSKVVHAASRQTVYIVGQRILKDKACPVTKILIPVDGSTYSIQGVEHAAYLAGELKGSIDKITILRVINLALYMERIKEGIDPEEEAKKILEEAKAVLLKAGVSEGLISTKVGVGAPADEILKEAEEGDYHLIIMGRKGRTALKDFILGGVSSTILQRCQDPTVAIVSSR